MRVPRHQSSSLKCFDYQTDWDLFSDVLEPRVPEWCRRRNVKREINEVRRYEFHTDNQLPMHHALYDALGNRYAFRSEVALTNEFEFNS